MCGKLVASERSLFGLGTGLMIAPSPSLQEFRKDRIKVGKCVEVMNQSCKQLTIESDVQII